ncbi:MAG: hypothetical protein F4Z04_10120 [Acidobacteria bacterium]|nr:hypothetical protein [Acidobacteriota bacterium]
MATNGRMRQDGRTAGRAIRRAMVAAAAAAVVLAAGAATPAVAQQPEAQQPEAELTEYLWAINESLWVGPAVGEDYTIEVSGGGWRPMPSLFASSEQFGILGTRIDFGSDLGLSRTDHPEVRATVKRGRQKLRVSVVPMRYEQEVQALARPITFHGIRFDAGLPIESALNWNAWRIGYELDVLSFSRGYLGLIAEAKYNQIDLSLETPSLDPEWLKVKAPIPAAGLVLRIYPTRFSPITAEVSGMRLPEGSLEEGHGYYFDLDVYATLNLARTFGLTVGYRAIDFSYLFERDSGDLKLEGFYLQAAVRY